VHDGFLMDDARDPDRVEPGTHARAPDHRADAGAVEPERPRRIFGQTGERLVGRIRDRRLGVDAGPGDVVVDRPQEVRGGPVAEPDVLGRLVAEPQLLAVAAARRPRSTTPNRASEWSESECPPWVPESSGWRRSKTDGSTSARCRSKNPFIVHQPSVSRRDGGAGRGPRGSSPA
jgi:hypothetical protein